MTLALSPHTPSLPPTTLPLSNLCALCRAPPHERHAHERPVAAFCIAPRRAGGRWRLTDTDTDADSDADSDADAERGDLPIPASSTRYGGTRGVWWALPRENVGDAPQKYHPLYVAAILTAKVEGAALVTAPPTAPLAGSARRHLSLAQWPIPRIAWTTATEVRRSMTLNGMRMSMEYAQTGSLRVLQLVESRLAAGQRDVAHDVLVYLMRQVMDVRAAEWEARDLRAQSVAAYLGLSEPRVRLLFEARRLTVASISAAITEGFAGPVRRTLDVPALIAGQLRHLRPQLQSLKAEEDKWLWLLDQSAARLYDGP